jgi:predicted tellurium resistance membrane protein TerC
MTDRTRRRIFTVLLAPSLALAAWGLVHLIGVDLVVSTGSGEVGPGDVLAAAFIGALVAWFAARVLERCSRRPRASWSFTASTALAVSMI